MFLGLLLSYCSAVKCQTMEWSNYISSNAIESYHIDDENNIELITSKYLLNDLKKLTFSSDGILWDSCLIQNKDNIVNKSIIHFLDESLLVNSNGDILSEGCDSNLDTIISLPINHIKNVIQNKNELILFYNDYDFQQPIIKSTFDLTDLSFNLIDSDTAKIWESNFILDQNNTFYCSSVDRTKRLVNLDLLDLNNNRIAGLFIDVDSPIGTCLPSLNNDGKVLIGWNEMNGNYSVAKGLLLDESLSIQSSFEWKLVDTLNSFIGDGYYIQYSYLYENGDILVCLFKNEGAYFYFGDLQIRKYTSTGELIWNHTVKDRYEFPLINHIKVDRENIYFLTESLSPDHGLKSTYFFKLIDTTLVQPETAEESSFMVYPNPTDGLVNIKSKDNIPIKIFNVAGQLVASRKESHNTTVHLSKGSYIILFYYQDKIVSKKLIVI